MTTTKTTFKRKWLKRFIAAALLGVLLILGMHGLLQSDLPRLGLQRILASRFKINATMNDLHVQWNGTTQIRQLEITQSQYPLPLIKIDKLTLSHTGLVRLLLMRPFHVKTLMASTLHVNIQQAQSGMWNVQALAESFPVSDTNSRKAASLPIVLPRLEVDHADITITDAEGTTARFDNSAFEGMARDTNTWTFSGNLGDALQLSGDIDLDHTLSHSLTLKYTDRQNLINRHVAANWNNFAVEGHWQGLLQASGLSGTLRLDKACADTFSSRGEVTVEASLRNVQASIKTFTCSLTQDPNHPVILESGRIRWQRQENTLSLDQAIVTGFGGRLTAQVNIPVNAPLETQATLTLSDLDLARLPRLLPAIKGLQGKASGTLITRVTQPEERALEPLQIKLALDLHDGRFEQAQIRSIQATAYMGSRRWLVDQSRIELLNGSIRFWVRSTQHPDERLTYINADFNDIDLKQALQSVGVNSEKAVGTASGKGVLIAGSLSGMTGQMDLSIDQADLLNTMVIGTLYNALNLNFFSSKKLSGRGRAKLVLDYHTLRLTEFEYFNRGIEVRGAGVAEDIRLGEKTPIQGHVMASTRPLKGVKLPGLTELDHLLTSLQKGTATVSVTNTLQDPKVSVVPFAQVQGIMKQILWIQLNPAGHNNQGSEAPK